MVATEVEAEQKQCVEGGWSGFTGSGASSLLGLHSWREGWREAGRPILPPTPIQLNSTAGIKQEFKIPPNCPTPLSGWLTKS